MSLYCNLIEMQDFNEQNNKDRLPKLSHSMMHRLKVVHINQFDLTKTHTFWMKKNCNTPWKGAGNDICTENSGFNKIKKRFFL